MLKTREAAQELQARLCLEARLPEAERGLFRLDHIGMWTKLRPGVRDFLAAAALLFELWIHTNGTGCAACVIHPVSAAHNIRDSKKFCCC